MNVHFASDLNCIAWLVVNQLSYWYPVRPSTNWNSHPFLRVCISIWGTRQKVDLLLCGGPPGNQSWVLSLGCLPSRSERGKGSRMLIGCCLYSVFVRSVCCMGSWMYWHFLLSTTCSGNRFHWATTPPRDEKNLLRLSVWYLEFWSLRECPRVLFLWPSASSFRNSSPACTLSNPWTNLNTSIISPHFLRSSRVVRLSLVKWFSYGIVLSPSISLVALLWTFSSLSMSLWRYGDQAWNVCSIWGCTRVL